MIVRHRYRGCFGDAFAVGRRQELARYFSWGEYSDTKVEATSRSSAARSAAAAAGCVTLRSLSAVKGRIPLLWARDSSARADAAVTRSGSPAAPNQMGDPARSVVPGTIPITRPD